MVGEVGHDVSGEDVGCEVEMLSRCSAGATNDVGLGLGEREAGEVSGNNDDEEGYDRGWPGW